MPTWIVALGFGTKFIFILLLGLSIWSVAIMTDRARVFSQIEKKNGLPEARRLIQEGRWADLEKWASTDTGFYAGMIQAMHTTKTRDARQTEHAAKSYLLDRRAELEKGLTVLATLGSNAPFIGLFGTVLGIIQAFAILGASNAGTNTVMSGISEALIATAIGLFVAIPAVVAFNIFSRRLKSIFSQVESLRNLYLSYRV